MKGFVSECDASIRLRFYYCDFVAKCGSCLVKIIGPEIWDVHFGHFIITLPIYNV